MNNADTAWILVATALVLFMTLPGLALFYGGMVRAKNLVSILMQTYAVAAVVSIGWFFLGYSFAFGTASPYLGGFDKAMLLGLVPSNLVGTIPEMLFFTYQMAFAIVTAALILGAFVERVKFSFVVIFCLLWSLLCYAPVAHWVWGGGFLSDGGIFGETGTRDFAGGIVVHQTAGIAALILAIMVGPRRDTSAGPHSPGLVMVGASMLWVGWFGFNGGSGLAANTDAAVAISVTHLSAASASIVWMCWEVFKFGKFTLVGMVTGTIAGLAVITPAAGYVGPLYAVGAGAVAGIICQEMVYSLRRMGIDDSLDVFAVHAMGGVFGAILVAALGVTSWAAQLGGIAIVGAYTAVVTLIIAVFCRGLVGMRVSAEEEDAGLDASVHGQIAYDLWPASTAPAPAPAEPEVPQQTPEAWRP